jgi:hypothetical protein
MSEFFSHYPKISYNVTGELGPTKLKLAIDIMNRVKIKDVVLDEIVQYQPYSIPEGERPDITAHKAYGDVKYTWLIFAMNDMHDPIRDWPLGTREFTTYIVSKYGSISNAAQSIHHYERILRQRVESTSSREAIPAYKIECDLTTYNTLGVDERNIVYNYTWEVDHNESKRDIKLIDRKNVSQILSEHTDKLL